MFRRVLYLHLWFAGLLVHAQVTINFSQPILRACGEVEIGGGFVAPGLQDVPLYWSWGDGGTSRSFFPALYRYGRDGMFTITASVRQGEQVLASRAVEVTVAGATRSQCAERLVVEPSQVLLRSGKTSEQLRVYRIGQDGTRMPLEAGAVRFRSRDTNVAQVTSAGIVSGSRFGDTVIDVEDPVTGRILPIQTQAGDIRLEPPYARLSLGATVEVQLRVVAQNADGTPLSMEGRRVTFEYNPVLREDPVISMSSAGMVRGLRVPRTFNETPTIVARVDGVESANITVVRVAQELPDLPYTDLNYGLTRFHIAPRLGRYDNREILIRSDVPRWTDWARGWEEHAAGFKVSRGGVRALIHEVGGSADVNDPTVPCGLSGNPTRLGANPVKEDNNSCLIVAVPPPARPYPQWFIYFHEIGHDQTLVSAKFSQLASAAGSGALPTSIREGFATTIGSYAAEMIRRNSRIYGVPSDVLEEMALTQIFPDAARWTKAVSDYEAGGNSFAKIDPDVMTGIITQLMREEGLAWYARFHSAFLPHNMPYDFTVDGERQASTVLVGAISAAIGRNMRTRFARWGFPLDDAYFDRVYPVMIQLTRQRQSLLTEEGITSAASYKAQAIAPDSWVSLFGSHLAPSFFQPQGLEPSLEGTSIWVTDTAGVERPAALQFVSPGHVNVLMPSGLAPGEGRIRVSTWLGDRVTKVTIQPVAPGLFAADASGRGPAAATWLRVSSDGSRSEGLVTDAAGKLFPIDLSGTNDSTYLSLYGTGFRNQTSVNVLVAGIEVPVVGAVAQGQFAGLDQLVVGPLPRSLAGKGEVSVLATFQGAPANPVTIAVR